ncbi:MAG: branched-chain amino acid transport system permease protein [Gaiellaceae bacterium]|jgi:neutral amino acid transport system permease protein|nr:branched-chain amino acid transport system permease protein [Gaiellaceae bacterium]
MFWQLLANGLVTGSVIAIAAAGVSLVYGILRLVNFAYGDFMAFGALAAYAFNGPLGLGMIPSTLLGMLATAVLSLVLDVALWRPLRARRAGFMSLFLASIGLALVLRQVLLLAYGPQPQTYKVDQFKVYVIGSVRLSEPQFITIIGATAAICALGVFLSRSTLGRTMRALADDRALAAIAGIRVGRVITYTWIISGLLAGLAGVFAGLVQSSFDPNFGFQLLLPVFAAVVLGGIGSAYGALAGGLVLGLAMELSTWTSLLGGVNPVYKPVVAFAILIVALMVRPQGLFGRARVV